MQTRFPLELQRRTIGCVYALPTPHYVLGVSLILIWCVFSANTAGAQMMSNLHYIIMVESGQIYFDSGYNQGVHEGMHFQIYRIDENGQPIKLARMVVTETFDQVSKGVLITEDIGVEVKIGDRVEILPMPEQTDIDGGMPRRSQTASGFRRWSWLALGGGLLGSGGALYFRNAMNTAYDKYSASVNPDEIEKHRDDTESHLWRYRVLAVVSIGLLGYSGYTLLWDSNAAEVEKISITPILSPEFSRSHVGATVRYAF